MDIDDEAGISSTQTFIRQRRNLLLITLLLIFIEGARVQVGEIAILGMRLSIGRPEVVPVFLWGIFGYFIIRYLQAWYENKEFVISQIYERFQREELNRTARLIALRSATIEDFCPDIEGTIEPYVISLDFIRNEPWRIEAKAQMGLRKVRPKEPPATQESMSQDVEISGLPLLISRFRAFCRASLATRLFTEYWVPLLLAMVLGGHKLITLLPHD